MTRTRFIKPCSPVPAKAVPVGDDWLHEVKFDGYRVQVHKADNEVVIFSRNGHDFHGPLPAHRHYAGRAAGQVRDPGW